MVAMILIMLRENFKRELSTKHHLFLTENYNWYLFETTCFFLVKGITPWLNDRKRVLSISGLHIYLSLEFSLLAAWVTPGARKTCPIYDTTVKQRRQMFLGFTSLGLNSFWRLALIDWLSRVLLGVTGGDAVLTPASSSHQSFTKGDIAFERRQVIQHTCHPQMAKVPWRRGKKYVFS